MNEPTMFSDPPPREVYSWVSKTYVKDLKASDVQNSNEMLSGLFGVKLLVDP